MFDCIGYVCQYFKETNQADVFFKCTTQNTSNKRYEFLTDKQKQPVNVMLYTSQPLSSAHYLKEKFLELLEHESGISKFISCANTYISWLRVFLTVLILHILMALQKVLTTQKQKSSAVV
jgi:hypothetical protein